MQFAPLDHQSRWVIFPLIPDKNQHKSRERVKTLRALCMDSFTNIFMLLVHFKGTPVGNHDSQEEDSTNSILSLDSAKET